MRPLGSQSPLLVSFFLSLGKPLVLSLVAYSGPEQARPALGGRDQVLTQKAAGLKQDLILVVVVVGRG